MLKPKLSHLNSEEKNPFIYKFTNSSRSFIMPPPKLVPLVGLDLSRLEMLDDYDEGRASAPVTRP